MTDTERLTAELAAIRYRIVGDGILANDRKRVLAAVEAVLALCRDTDGNDLPGYAELPVGEFQAAISSALLGEDGT